jgi:hypothetical protein
METGGTSETSINFYGTAQDNITEDSNFNVVFLQTDNQK